MPSCAWLTACTSMRSCAHRAARCLTWVWCDACNCTAKAKLKRWANWTIATRKLDIQWTPYLKIAQLSHNLLGEYIAGTLHHHDEVLILCSTHTPFTCAVSSFNSGGCVCVCDSTMHRRLGGESASHPTPGTGKTFRFVRACARCLSCH